MLVKNLFVGENHLLNRSDVDKKYVSEIHYISETVCWYFQLHTEKFVKYQQHTRECC